LTKTGSPDSPEARMLAVLNHPNVAQIYGVEDAAGHQRALAMEFVEGDDLASRR
jgi:serine/threonine protein kinase